MELVRREEVKFWVASCLEAKGPGLFNRGLMRYYLPGDITYLHATNSFSCPFPHIKTLKTFFFRPTGNLNSTIRSHRLLFITRNAINLNRKHTMCSVMIFSIALHFQAQASSEVLCVSVVLKYNGLIKRRLDTKRIHCCLRWIDWHPQQTSCVLKELFERSRAAVPLLVCQEKFHLLIGSVWKYSKTQKP